MEERIVWFLGNLDLNLVRFLYLGKYFYFNVFVLIYFFNSIKYRIFNRYESI